MPLACPLHEFVLLVAIPFLHFFDQPVVVPSDLEEIVM
jgi:hypothetical protein